MKRIVATLVFATIFAATLARELPDFIHVCKKNEPNLGDCIKASVENVKPYLIAGLPEYNIPSLEPLLLNELVAAPGNTIKLKLRNLIVHGASNFTVTKIKANIDTLRFVVELDFPDLSLHGDYDIDGKVILLRIQGSGPMNGNFTDCKGQIKLQAATTKGNDGQTYVKIVDFKTKIYVGRGELRLDNLFGGDRALGDAINGVINSNFDAFIKELEPSLESAISDTFQKIANSILTQFTYETLFPV
ncbi:circadian clock-controlled protein daywake [Nomia melanderi]|uniref:circadian clock-controlled protein daywake n=1 Tax=Nomia melanderi TaxID=2448451 RepID=UPI001304630A|nr:protein takeout [Nomia melanderi]XP_031842205.1 protein takeout [Nomia melanderi]